jgi:hypothetical protein
MRSGPNQRIVDIGKSKVKGRKCDSIPTREMLKCEKPKCRNTKRLKRRDMERQNVEMLKDEIPKYQTDDLNPFQISRYRRLEVSKHFIKEMMKHQKSECRNTGPLI